MTAQLILDRSYGFSPHDAFRRAATSRLVYALQPAPSVTFSEQLPADEYSELPPAHTSGVNALAIDKFEGRYLLSGGADSSVAIWDLEADQEPSDRQPTYTPLSFIERSAKEHRLGITQVAFYPFDSLAFLTSSYDHHVKIYSSETMVPSASFNLDSVVYNIALSPIAPHLLVACGTQHSIVRLVDLRSGASSHSLAGHTGAVLSTAWSPVRENVLASGGTDGSVRFWDVRRGNSQLGLLDLEDSIGVLEKPSSSFTGNYALGKAHRGPVNGIVWTEDGKHVVTCGHDDRIRVWDTDTGANTLVNFGPMIRNSGLAPRIPLLVPALHSLTEQDVMFYPNRNEILGYELFEGKLIRRLKLPEQHKPVAEASSKIQRNTKERVNALAWRAHDVEMYSAHSDGSISAWKPRTAEDADLDEEEEQEREAKEEDKKRKRGVLDDIYQGLTKRPVTFGGIS
ncbi:WD40 repeat-like protein [Corynespora cassiicola Philippines]|uniref:WD40 repeat-like protein n=1 Tax=Corynespora cassiicola Philippines TaxID=1448308 RepID=A0A2T2N5A2_CORCC|nr:WD40 repeat-like protein [Corynespora cassiicola Philippines]